MAHILVWDIETVPDLRGFAAAYSLDGKSDEPDPRELMRPVPAEPMRLWQISEPMKSSTTTRKTSPRL
jgi:putative SOS response-associated peptidase YedK